MTVSTEGEQTPPKEQASASELVLQPRESMKTLQLSVLKDLTDDVNIELKTLAEELDIPYQTVNTIVMDFVRAMIGTYKVDWPDRVRGLYNADITDPELLLTSEDMNILKAVVSRFHKKKLEKLTRKTVKAQTQAPAQAVYADSYGKQQPQPQPPKPPTPEEYMKGFGLPTVPYVDAITLMKFCLDITFLGPRAGQVSPFLQKFQLWKDSWLRNPGSLLAAFGLQTSKSDSCAWRYGNGNATGRKSSRL